ncbi:MAG: hypothetical protein AAAB16_03995 [Pseudomonas sp.]|uniref:hypothetical protein n=1 Tax=Pseudomonas sp. TaxID=306 RepID=UPI0030EFC487
MKKLNFAKGATGINSWIGVCTLSVMTLSISHAFAAVNCPSGQYANDSGGCSVSNGYTPIDQGSVAQQHLDNYYKNEDLFSAYQKQWEEWNNKNLQLSQQLNQPLIEQYQLLALRLAKWQKEDSKSFADYFKQIQTTIPIDLARDIPNDLSSDNHRSFMMAFVMDAYAKGKYSLLVAQYNANLKKTAQLYFRMNPTLMKSIRINYWTKAYAPSVSGKWGFTRSYSDSLSLRELQSVYPFIRPADAADYDFSQTEESFSDTWNNASTSPSTHKAKATKYYKFVPQALPESFTKSLRESINPRLTAQVNSETLAQTQSKVVGFGFNSLMSSYLSANTSREEFLKSAANLALAFPQANAITQVTRVVNQAKKTCLAPAQAQVSTQNINIDYSVETINCNSATRSMDWYVIENEDKTIQLKNSLSGQCLTSPRQADTGVVTLVCGGRINTYEPSAQNWQWTGDDRLRRSGKDHLYSLSVMAPTDLSLSARAGRTVDIYPYDYLQGNDAYRAQWLINTGDRRNEMLTAENYKTAEAIGKHFFVLMYGFTEELPFMDRMKSVHAGKNLPTEDANRRLKTERYTSQERAKAFFDKIYSNGDLYNQLPTSIKDFIAALHAGTPLLDAYSQHALALYDDIRKIYMYKPTTWNDESNSVGSLQTYENPKDNSVDIFISKFNGNPATSNKALPTNKTSNENWTYLASLGSKEQVKKLVSGISNYFPEWGKAANYGDIFQYNNPVSKTLEFFQANFKGMASNSATYFPTNQTSNNKWRYLGQQNSATVLLAALANDMNTAYLSYMYNLIKLNIGTKQTIPDIEQSLSSTTTEDEQDGLGFGNWVATSPSYDIAGQPSLGQYFYVSSPTVAGASLYKSSNIGALSALSNALISMKFDPAQQADIMLKRVIMRQQFEEMLNPRTSEIIRASGLGQSTEFPDEATGYPGWSRYIFDEWSEGRLNPPEGFQEFRANFRALFSPGAQGDAEFDSFIADSENVAIEQANQGLLVLNNSSLSTAFNALTITGSTIAVSTVSVSAALSTIFGLGL